MEVAGKSVGLPIEVAFWTARLGFCGRGAVDL